MLEVREGTLKGGLPYKSLGDGPPLVVFVAGGSSNANPSGWQRQYEVRWLAPLARGLTVYRVNPKIGPERGATTFADLADDYLAAVLGSFGKPPGMR